MNADVSGQQRDPDISMDDQGRFVVVWEDDDEGNGKHEIMAKGYRVTAANQRLVAFSDIRINTNAAGRQLAPDVALGGSQDFVVTWEDDYDLNGKYQIRAKGYRLNGTSAPILRFGELFVNSDNSGQQVDPSIDMDATGSFVVSWEDDHDVNGKYDVWVRGFYSTGAERFADLRANKGTDGQQRNSEVALGPGGRVLVGWADDINGNGKGEIVLRGIEML